MTGLANGLAGGFISGFLSCWARSQDGLRLHARIYGQPSGAPSSGNLPADGLPVGDLPVGHLPVVCLPGLTRNASEFHLLAESLRAAEPDRRIVAVDYRGRGRSDHDPDPSHYAIPVEAADLLAMLASLEIPRAVFVGVSRGGLIAMGLGAQRPDLVAGIVLSDIGPVVEREGLLRIKGYVGRLGEPADLDEAAQLLRARFGAHFPALSGADWRDWAETVWVSEAGRLVVAYDPALSRTLDGVDADSPIPDLWQVYDAIPDMPMLVVRGQLSDLLSAATVDEMARRRPGLEAIEVLGEGHTPILHRPALVSRIADLLRRAS